MKYEHIEDLAYYMKQAKANGQNKPIVFLGAGASKTGNIPLANEIVEKIKTEFDTPKIKRLSEKDITYAKLMECLTPFERNSLLKSYIDNGKINVIHLYLAHLMKEDYIDYVLTVNFDNLMLRALSLYNIFPPTYDMAVLKDLTTTTFEKGSVVYLHGQHHGLWLLNTPEEMAKVNTVIPPILNKLADKRPWIFIGYSGEDPIFNHIINLGRFDNGLYWVQYKDTCPSDKVCDGLLRKENTNAYVIKDYDADSFMVTLANNLGLLQPEIINKPFSALYKQLDNINDINDESHFKHVKERLNISKLQVNEAINQFESGKIKKLKEIKSSTKFNLLKKSLLNLSFETEFGEDFVSVFNSLQLAIEKLDSNELDELRAILAQIFFKWAIAEPNIEESISKYGEAIKYDSSIPSYYALRGLQYQEVLKYQEAELDYSNAISLCPTDISYYGLRADLNKKKGNYEEALKDYNKIVEIRPKFGAGYSSRGFLLNKLDRTEEAISDYQKAYELGNGAYNLACGLALMNENSNALKYLEETLENREISIEHIEEDKNWDSFRNDSDFIALLDKYRN